MQNKVPANYKLTAYTDHAQKLVINTERKNKVLKFIAENNWATVSNLQSFIQVRHRQSVTRLLDDLVGTGKLFVNKTLVNNVSHNVYTITNLGCFSIKLRYRYYQFRLSAQNFLHATKVQSLQIISLSFGFTWINELNIIRSKLYSSQPDGILIVPNNSVKISIELQRNKLNINSFKAKINKCLADALNKKFTSILYVCTDNVTADIMSRAFNSINSVKGKNNKSVILTPEYRKCFEFINIIDYHNYLNKLILQE